MAILDRLVPRNAPDVDPNNPEAKPLPKVAPDVEEDFNLIDRFATALKGKLAASAQKGRSGWRDPNQCSVRHLAELLVHQLVAKEKADPLNIGIYAMMLHHRGGQGELQLAITEFLDSYVESAKGLPTAPRVETSSDDALRGVIAQLDALPSGQLPGDVANQLARIRQLASDSLGGGI